MYSYVFSSFKHTPRWGAVSHVITLCQTSWGTTRLFSKVAARFYTLTSSAGRYQFLHVLVNTCYFPFKNDDSYPNECGVIAHCGFLSSIFKMIPTKYNLFNPSRKGLLKIKINFQLFIVKRLENTDKQKSGKPKSSIISPPGENQCYGVEHILDSFPMKYLENIVDSVKPIGGIIGRYFWARRILPT